MDDVRRAVGECRATATAIALRRLRGSLLWIFKLVTQLGCLIIPATTDSMPVPKHIFNQIKAIIPPLNGTLHKGQSGRVGVLGGALEYAPRITCTSAN